MNARELLNRAYSDLGVRGLRDTLDTALAQDGLDRLNNMVNGWRIQRLTILAVERQIFNLVANQQTYSIGPGAQFNVPRPVRLDGAALLLNGLGASQSVTLARSGYTATGTATAHGYAVGGQVLINGASQDAYNGVQTLLSVTANTFTFTVDSTPTTPATGTITVQGLTAAAGSPPATEIPRAVYTDDAYQANQVKNLQSSQFTGVYYNPTQAPYGSIWLWPCPTTADNQLVLYLANQFTGFADLTTDYTWPDTPGFAEALEYNVAVRLIAPNGVSSQTVISFVTKLAGDSLAEIKRANVKLTDIPVDPIFTRDGRGGYNINTGTGG